MQSRTVGPLKFLSIPPQDVRIELDPVPQGAERPETGQQIIDRLHPDALICGPMFEVTANQNPSGTAYSQYAVAKLIYRYLDTKRGINVQSSYPTRGGTISVIGNTASFFGGDQIPPGAEFAIQGYPSLIQNGRNVASASIDTQNEGRCAVGILSDGSIVFAEATLGMFAFANAMIAAGVQWAVYLDGGGSTTLYGGGFNIGLQARRLPAYLMAIRSTTEAIHDGMNTVVGGVVHSTITKTLLPAIAVGLALLFFISEES